MSGQCFLCGVHSSQVCPDCGDVFYCSEYHLSKHRVGNTCLPFKIQVYGIDILVVKIEVVI